MGRKVKAHEEYLMAAIEVFWRKGYEGASLSDLTEHLGIGAQSLYNKFGDKMGLYQATIQFFINMSEMGFSLTLNSKPDASLDEIILHFAINRQMQILDDDKEVCYVVSCSLEMSSLNLRVEELSNKFFTMLKDAFKRAIINAQNKGEISNKKDPDNLAWYLVNTIGAVGIMRKSGVPIPKIDEVLDFSFRMLDGYTTDLFEQKKLEADAMYPAIRKTLYDSKWWDMELTPEKMKTMIDFEN